MSSRDTFQSAVFFWQPDLVRGERVNVGIAVTSPQSKFSRARFLGLEELRPLGKLFYSSEQEIEWLSTILVDYAEVVQEARELGRDFSLRYDHPHIFTALFGRSQEGSAIQWRSASSGLILTSPQETLDELFERYIARGQRRTSE